MGQEYIILSVVRIGLLAFSFIALPPSVLLVKTAWQTNDSAKMRKGIVLLWGAILAGCLFLKMFKGVS